MNTHFQMIANDNRFLKTVSVNTVELAEKELRYYETFKL